MTEETAKLDEAERNLSRLGRSALRYVRMGLAVFPCEPHGKKPNTINGVNGCTKNQAAVIEYWSANPYDNIGIATGASGLLVFDLDVGETKDGTKALHEWEKLYGKLPETASVITGGGGYHLIYSTGRAELHPSANQEFGIDVRAGTSYIVAPPSVHPNGNEYEWEADPDDVGITPANERVYDLLDYVQRNGSHNEMTSETGKFRLPDKIRAGGRNDTLFRYASHLRAIGRSDDEILNAVAGANFTKCATPLGMDEVRTIVKQACRYDRGESNDTERMVGAPGTTPSTDFRGKRGGIMTNLLAQEVIKTNFARIIDGAPATWSGTKWEYGVRAINRCTLALADDAKKQDKSEVASYIMDKAPRVSSDTEFDGGYYVQFRNCTWDVINECEVTPTPKMFITATLPVDLRLDVGRNQADEFLGSISGGDKNVMAVLAECIGACMCSRRVISKAFMLVGKAGGASGKASNGKSTYINWLRAIVGTENVTSMDIETLGQRFQAGRLAGKNANLGDDIPDSFLGGGELSIFKKLTTGDSIYTDVKNGDGFEFRPNCVLVFSMNKVPGLKDTTEGIYRRLAFVPFYSHFEPGTDGYDPNMAERLARQEVLERGALLGLRALRAMILRGGTLTDIPEMAAEIDEVKQDNNSVLRWLTENEITAERLDGRPVATLYEDYKDWCAESGERNPFARRTWTSKVKDAATFENSERSKRLDVVPRHIENGGKNVRVFVSCYV